MTLSPGVRKLALTTHVTASVGWLGSVAAFLALAVAGLRSTAAEMGRSAYVAMALVAWFVNSLSRSLRSPPGSSSR